MLSADPEHVKLQVGECYPLTAALLTRKWVVLSADCKPVNLQAGECYPLTAALLTRKWVGVIR